jgi:hypothetical protein
MGDEFAGDTFLALAGDGRLVVGPERADALIADLERTIAILTERLAALDRWQRTTRPCLDDLSPELAETVVDAVFGDQLSPGRTERVIRELPKYVAALRAARSNAGVTGD